MRLSWLREDLQIDFAMENGLNIWGEGGGNKNVSQILATINFSSGEITGRAFVGMKEFYM